MSNIKNLLNKTKEPNNLIVLIIYLFLLTSVLFKSFSATFILTTIFTLVLVVGNNVLLGFYLGLFSISFDQIFVPVGFSLKLHMIIFLSVFITLLLSAATKRKMPKLPPKYLTIPLVILFIFSLLSYFSAADKFITIRFLGALVYAYAVFIITYVLVTDKANAVNSLLALFGSAIISSVVALYQYTAFYFGIDFYAQTNILNPGNFARPKGFFDHTNFLANFFLTAIPISLARFLWDKHKNIINIILISIPITALIVTFSRGAYISIIIAVVIILIFLFNRNQAFLFVKKGAMIVLVSGVFLWLLLFVIGPLRTGYKPAEDIGKSQRDLLAYRANSSFDPQAITNIERIQIWRAGTKMLKDYWLTGVGLENFRLVYHKYKLPEAVRSQVSAHNTYFQLLLETGIFGFLSFAGFVLALAFNALKAILRAKDLVLRSLLIGGLAALVAVTLQNLTNSVFYYAHTWFLYGFVAALTSINLSKK